MRSQKKSNPFSGRGLDKFARLNAELAAKREEVARKNGVTPDAVRFVSRDRRWVPVVVKKSNNWDDGYRDSIMAPVETVAPVQTVGAVETMAPVESKAIQERKAIEERRFEGNDNVDLEGSIHGAIAMIVVLLYMIYGGTLCAVLWACACCCWCVLAVLRKGKHGFFHENKNRIRITIDFETKREKMNMD